MKKTPLYAWHTAAHAKMAPFGGWDMPIQFSGIVNEHLHTREKATIFDTCHMGEFHLKGHKACDDINHLVTAPIASLKPGRCRYAFLLNDNGGVMDDLIVYRHDETTFMLVVNAGTCENDAQWIKEHLSSDTVFQNLSDTLAKIDVQGPLSTDVLQPLTKISLDALPYFGFATGPVMGMPAVISRTGYTGERGYEVYLPADKCLALWEKLAAHPDVIPAGLGARDTLRLEAGLPLYGHELSAEHTPAGAGFDFAISLKKDYIGKEPLAKEMTDGPSHVLCGLACTGRRAPRHGYTVHHDSTSVGTVTSGSFAPSCGYAIALAYVLPDYAHEGTKLQIATERTHIDATVVPLPFYTGTARA